MVNIIDLTSAFSLISKKKGWSEYESLYPEVFAHYFHIWAKRSYPDVSISFPQLETNSRRIRHRMRVIQKAFQIVGLSLDDIEIVLFVGKYTSNGHAFHLRDKMVVWLPVETYPSRDLIDVFVTHEIAHALHYRHSPKYRFAGIRDQRNFGRSLVTEGVATYVTAQVLGCSDGYALWAKHLSAKDLGQWLQQCENRFGELCRIAVRDLGSGRNAVMFRADDPRDILRFRAGYLVGLKVIQQIVADNGLSLRELISMPRSKLDRLAKKCLLGHAKTL